jgi:hypothetical protein
MLCVVSVKGVSEKLKCVEDWYEITTPSELNKFLDGGLNAAQEKLQKQPHL